MASISRTQRAAELRSGGKIVRARRTVAPRTPYERPPRFLPNSPPQNPNWLSRLILSPTRMIATGAEDDADDANDDNVIASQDATRLEKNQTFEKINASRKDPQVLEWKSETKRAIEQIIMRETFSREECDRLIHIIKSRVVDSPITGGLAGRLNEIPDSTGFREEKKLVSNSKSELECGTCTLNTAMLPQVTEDEVGSPADIAKSYMQARPPWASPSLSNIQLQSPSPMGIQLFKEETPNLFGGSSMPSSKLFRNSSATGSWNILEEVRKVRSKATEEMLRTRPSSIIDWPTLASDDKRSPYSLVPDKAEPVSQIAQQGLQNEASPPDVATSICKQSQDLGATQIIEGVEEGSHGQRLEPSEYMKISRPCGDADVDDPNDADGVCEPLNHTVAGDTRDSTLHEINCSTMAEVAVRNVAVTANGFPPSGSSLAASLQGEEKSKPSDEQHHLVDSAHDNLTRVAPVGETCEHLSESYMEVAIVNENGTEPAGSQNSSSLHHEELSQDLPPPNLKRNAVKSNDVAVIEKRTRKRIYRSRV
ncbi:hypothetical protein GH714_011931 [Hevea brasiliensis]|uniref:Protein KAKU4 n=1 Tax=Hevea brasiliensis TaxID=3981 RepID=A0A6A6K4S6_HEVBR|nr:hypothetical protein GH714_011931 [Hevea brasiliensis]